MCSIIQRVYCVHVPDYSWLCGMNDKLSDDTGLDTWTSCTLTDILVWIY